MRTKAAELIAAALAVCACAPVEPKTPAECRQLRTQRDVEMVVGILGATGCSVAAVVSLKTRDPSRTGPRGLWTGIAIGSAGISTVSQAHAWYSDQQADNFCREFER